MPEATMICCDCSEWMRNGDVVPNRFESQVDAVGLIANTKTEQNHENTVGLISMNGNGKSEVLVNCTSDVGRVLSSLSKMRINGNADILIALQTAQLALKHRKNKKQDQRIILFVGSPVKANEKQLIKSGKRLKKNNVAVDIVSFGETEENSQILEAFINAVKSNDNSNLITIGTGRLISDELSATSIFRMPGGGDFGGSGGITGQSEEAQIAAATAASMANNQFADTGGIDPNMDPEMAMAIRMSLEEERQRQQQNAPPQESNNNNDKNENADTEMVDANANANANNNSNDNNNNNNNNNENNGNEEEDDEDAELMMALKMSLMENDDANENDTQNVQNQQTQATNENEENTEQVEDDDQAMLDDLLQDLPGLNEDDLDDILQDTQDKEDNNDKKDKNDKDDKGYKD